MNCIKCGRCCCDISLLKDEYNKLLKGKQFTNKIVDLGSTVFISGKCPLLNKDNTCSVYKHRPFVCQAYPLILDVVNGSNDRIFITDFCSQYKSVTKKEIKRGKILLNVIMSKVRNLNVELDIAKIFESIKEFITLGKQYHTIPLHKFKCSK